MKRSSNCLNAISESVQLRLNLWGKGRGQREDSNELGIREIGRENGRNRSLNGVWPELRRKSQLRGEREEKGRREREEKWEIWTRFAYIYTLPKITKPTL